MTTYQFILNGTPIYTFYKRECGELLIKALSCLGTCGIIETERDGYLSEEASLREEKNLIYAVLDSIFLEPTISKYEIFSDLLDLYSDCYKDEYGFRPRCEFERMWNYKGHIDLLYKLDEQFEMWEKSGRPSAMADMPIVFCE